MHHTVKSFDIDGSYPVYKDKLCRTRRLVHGENGQIGYALVDGRQIQVMYDSDLKMWVTPVFKFQSQQARIFAVA